MESRRRNLDGGIRTVESTGCPRKFVPRLPEDYDKAAKGSHHTFT